MENLYNLIPIRKVFEKMRQTNISVEDDILIDYAINFLEEYIPKQNIEDKESYFFRFFNKKNNNELAKTLEISVLTRNYIADLAVTSGNQIFTFVPIDEKTIITFETNRTEDSKDLYRVKLEIANNILEPALAYEVEGDRQAIKRLISYAKACIFRINQLKGN
jgi:hypothetical protein